ncbi:MAG: hypothetical protein NTV86_10085 [Planctomycetota bacterium]|nr:hypothetical protein [Planctomycetota bacterium]
MEIYPDFKELLELFNAQRVEYLVVGGYALAFHGVVRATKDMDLYVRPTTANAQRVMAALDVFGFGQTGLKPEDFQKPGQVIQLGFPPVRIDLITSIEGVSWEQAYGGKTPGNYGGEPVPFLGRAEFIANKKAAGRLQDLADVEALEGPLPDEP